MVSLPAEYQWSSYVTFIGKYKAPRFLEISWLMSNFGRTKKEAKRNYQDFVEKVVQAVTQEFNCNPERIIAKGRKKNKAREVALYGAPDMSGMSCKDLGEYFGGVSGALITIMHNRIADEYKRNRRLKRRIDKIRNQIFNI